MTTNLEIANTIIEQLGHQALYMLGVHGTNRPIAIENGVQLKIKGSRTCNTIQITLDANDTYTVRFSKSRLDRKTFTHTDRETAQFEGVYWDGLKRVIEQSTGLYTSL